MYLTIQGIVLRVSDYSDHDALLTVLTRKHGKLTVKARGLRRKNSPLTAVCQLLAYGEFTLFEYRGQYSINEAHVLNLFQKLRGNLENLSLASYFAELTESLTDADDASPEVLSLLLNALYALGTLQKDPQLVKPAFELRLMALSGFEPLADGCAVCGRPEPEQPMLDVTQGVVHCAGCKQMGGLSLPLCSGALAALRHVLYGESKRLYSFRLDKPALNQLDHVSEAFIAAQLERGFRTLDYYKSIRTEH